MDEEQHAQFKDILSSPMLSDEVHEDLNLFSSMKEGNKITKITVNTSEPEPENFGGTTNVQSLSRGTKRKRDEFNDDDEDEDDDDFDALERAEESIGSAQIEMDHPDKSKLMMWHYVDPQGDVQGPFLLEALKFWYDMKYFPPDFKVWKIGENRDEAVLLDDVLHKEFSS